ncbi:redoxin domain-containing protein [Salipaludibacillus sp. HK11]|uniref:redoxin domain-containing protein n=1 Tax=Salipaludibacillus sp. HK11 TaxID=3394320 RepID=UPI0039FD97D1
MSQLVELNAHVSEIEQLGYSVYGISSSDPGSHEILVEGEGLNFELLTDEEFEFGTELGFVDIEAQTIVRGYTAVNPVTGEIRTETDYLVGENADEVLQVLEGL